MNLSIKHKNLIRIVIYSLCVLVLLIFWIISIQKVKSLQKSYASENQNIENDIANNYQTKFSTLDINPLDLGLLGEKLVQNGYTEFGLIALEESLKRSQDYRDLYLYTAKVYFDQQNYQKAKEKIEESFKLDPIYAPAYELLALTYQKLGDAENAEICYNKSKDFSR